MASESVFALTLHLCGDVSARRVFVDLSEGSSDGWPREGALSGAFALRLDDWPTYVVFLVLAIFLFWPAVDVVPGLALPMPSLVLTIGFLYIGGLPIVFLRNVVPPTLQFLRFLLPERWQRQLPDRFWATQ
jgi:hypothetical protein